MISNLHEELAKRHAREAAGRARRMKKARVLVHRLIGLGMPKDKIALHCGVRKSHISALDRGSAQGASLAMVRLLFKLWTEAV